jgi:hypothetical protein
MTLCCHAERSPRTKSSAAKSKHPYYHHGSRHEPLSAVTRQQVAYDLKKSEQNKKIMACVARIVPITSAV